MENAIEILNFHYEKLVDLYIQKYRFKGNVLSYKDVFVGYSLFEIGKCMELYNALNNLIDFLDKATVNTTKKMK